ncbi:MAG: S41 family peptidase [Bacilli bacterium]|nr:S41 family peptidase [Bacilli bacterium]
MKSEEKTKNKLKKLSNALGKIDIRKSANNKKDTSKKENSNFQTKEVIVLLILTSIVSILMGGLISYKLYFKLGSSVDKELATFIKNYEYIVNNYYDKIDKSKLLDAAVAGMLETLDKNSSYVGSEEDDFNLKLEGNYEGVGIQVYNDEDKNIVVYSVFENSPASKAGLKEGDILLKVDDEEVTGKTTKEVSEIIKSKKGEFKITYKREDNTKTIKITLSKVDLPSVTSKTIEKDGKKVGYIYTSIFASNTDKQFEKHLKKLEKEKIDSLIIDLRDNSGGHLSAAENIVSLFLDSTHPIYQIESKGETNKYYSKGNKDKKYKIILLVNSSSASASEVTSSALKEQCGATLIGEKTYGKGTVQELQTLPDGQQYKLTTKKWLTSKGKVVDGKGLEVDIEVSLDPKYAEEPKEENDNQFQKALEEAVK